MTILDLLPGQSGVITKIGGSGKLRHRIFGRFVRLGLELEREQALTI